MRIVIDVEREDSPLEDEDLRGALGWVASLIEVSDVGGAYVDGPRIEGPGILNAVYSVREVPK